MARNNGRDGIPRIGRPDRSAAKPAEGAYSDPAPETGPVDIASVRRDDEFIEAIRGDGPVATDNADEYQLALLLAGWRAEITTPALPSGPELDDVVAAVDEEIRAAGLNRRSKERSRPSLLRPVAGAAAAIAVVLGGLVVFSYNSAPGDPLWSVKSVVFSQQADSTVAQIDTTSKLSQAEELIAAGDVEGARALLDGATETSGGVIDPAQKSDLEIWLQRLTEQLQALIPTFPSIPPLPSFDPQLPPTDVFVPPVQPGIPVTSVPDVPLPQTSTGVPLPPTDTSGPISQEPSSPPVTQTTAPVPPTILNEPSPTTASASGSTGTGTGTGESPSRIDTSQNGG
ncbi:anti-sigma-D factor RsdA [Rhodococcoides kyotonense]|uniref:Anti-sigma-D factor RsdA to sigma factor binding region n=1 Tax=Rhodococcoides kyotonense TaxID=398843 RepID=A0A239MNZ7_9NOCA|nr:anti-sigma-D factor RsdA [Rhodococcus kyotonensis]SNT44210.1 Anti-sigma-D factor RsdA to sigma factor binding region [Rhodococcus kyotonensis]